MINFSAIAPEVFQILKTRDYVVDIYDDSGNKVIEPSDGRRFYIQGENHLIALVDNNDDSVLKVRLSKTADINNLKVFLDTLRTCANKYNMLFDAKKGDREYSPKDFATSHAITNEGRNFMHDLTEGMYGTSRSSYLKLENARMIVRHSERINEEVMGARSRKVESIFIENAQGERMLFPTRQIAPARAMATHVDHGGTFYDAIGQQFQRMAVDYQNLGQCSAFVYSNMGGLAESASALREGCRTKLREMRRVFERCYRSESGYLNETAMLAEAGEPALVEATVLESIREILAMDGKSLDESVIETVGRLVGTASTMLDEADKPAKEFTIVRFAPGGQGFEIEKSVWQDFVSGNIDMIGAPSEDDRPNFRNDAEGKLGELLFKLGTVVPQVRDDRLVSILSHVCERLPELAENPRAHADEIRKMKMIAGHALKAVNVSYSPIVTETIREFAEWFRSFDPERVLLSERFEDDWTARDWANDEAGPTAAQKELAVADVIANFRVADFLASDFASDFNYGDVSPKSDEEDRTYSINYVRSSLAAYLSDLMKTDHSVEDEMDDVAKDLWPAVQAKLELDGYIFSATEGLSESYEEPSEDTLMCEGVGFEGILTTNSKGVWSSQGRGTNNDGVQGFYYTTELSDGHRADLFVHDAEKAYDLVVAKGDQVSSTTSGEFNTAFDLSAQVDEMVQQHMAPAASDIAVDAAAVPVVADIETGPMDLPDMAPEAVPVASEGIPGDDLADLEFSTGSLDADTAWSRSGDVEEVEEDFGYGYDDRGDDDDRYAEIDSNDNPDIDFQYDGQDASDIYAGVLDQDFDDGMSERTLLDDIDPEADGELTREDVLLPKNQGDDLQKEVRADVPDQEVERIAALAGVKKSLNGGM